jgi:hypothetical protein
MIETKPFTHSAFIFKDEGSTNGRRMGRWINGGNARIEPDGSIFVYLHTIPIRDFDGHIRCLEIGSKPPEEIPPPSHNPRDEADNDHIEDWTW